ncbi:MAG: adenine deaminase [Oligoflexia bacterium]|nr:adenine deaminase [Oligoflexia bacterium]
MLKKKLTKQELSSRIDAARGQVLCDLVLRGAKWLDVFSGQWLGGDIAIDAGVIVGVGEKYEGKKVINLKGRYIVPGFIDSHVHVESTLMVPSEFERVVLPRGTTSAILDPHEIVNVMGVKGLEYILACAEKAQMDMFIMLSSCVPATHLETSGAKLSAQDLLPFKNHPKVLGLAEMMNYPGVLNKDPEVLEKIFQFQDVHIDGHSPMLRGRDLNAYLACGIKTCHESISQDEAQEKLERGMQVMLREGSVAKNLRELVGVLTEFSSPHVSLCTDDRNPLDILDEGHIDYLIRMAIKAGAPAPAVYRAASLSTAQCFGIKGRGAIAPGWDADIVVLKDYKKCVVEKVIKAGRFVDVAELGQELVLAPHENSMRCTVPGVDQIQVSVIVNDSSEQIIRKPASVDVRVIGIVADNIVTESLSAKLNVNTHGFVQPDLKQDVLKIVVVERHGRHIAPSVGFVKGLGIKSGAIGSSVGHDSHNAVVIGVNDEDIVKCFSRLKELGGGFVVVKNGKILAELALPVAGLMTNAPLKDIYKNLKLLRKNASGLGCKLTDPFLQMAFLCLAVIPKLKITDRGLVDVDKFDFVSVVIT